MAHGLRRCFGLRSIVATAFADNQVGRLVEDLILQGGVDTSMATKAEVLALAGGGSARVVR